MISTRTVTRRRPGTLARVAWTLLTACAIGLLPGAASAQGLRVTTIEGDEVRVAIERIQNDATVTTATIRVLALRQGGRPAACGAYRIRLDAGGQQAFSIVDCDPGTNATALRLVSRHALFTAGDLVPARRTFAIRADAVANPPAAAAPGQPAAQAAAGAADISCSSTGVITIRPFLVNPVDGSQVPLTPGPRFELRVGGATLTPRDGVWSVDGPAGQSMRIAFELRDVANGGRIVVSGEKYIACAAPVAATAPPTVVGREAEPSGPIVQTDPNAPSTPSVQAPPAVTPVGVNAAAVSPPSASPVGSSENRRSSAAVVALMSGLVGVGGIGLFVYSYVYAWTPWPSIGLMVGGVAGTLCAALYVSNDRASSASITHPRFNGFAVLPRIGTPGVEASLSVSF